MSCLQLAWILVYSLAHFWKKKMSSHSFSSAANASLAPIFFFSFRFVKLFEEKGLQETTVYCSNNVMIFWMLQKISSILSFNIQFSRSRNHHPQKSSFFCQNYENFERRSLLGRETRYILPYTHFLPNGDADFWSRKTKQNNHSC